MRPHKVNPYRAAAPERMLQVLLIGEMADIDQLFEREAFAKEYAIEARRVRDLSRLDHALGESPVDAVVIEALPNGLDVLSKVRERCPVTPVMMVADTDQIDLIIEAKKAGLERYVLRTPEREKSLELFAQEFNSMLSHIVEPPSVEFPSAEALHRYAQFHNVLEPFFVLSSAAKLLYFNDAGRRLVRERFGVEISTGAILEEWTLEDDDERFREHVRRALDGERISVPQQLRGEPTLHQRLEYQPVFDGNGRLLAVSVAVANVTALRTVELRLAEGYQKGWKLFDRIPLPLAVLDDDTVVHRANEAFYRLVDPNTEHPNGEFAAGFSLAEHADSEHVEALQTQMTDVRLGRSAYVHQETCFRGEDGREVWGEMTGLPLGVRAPDGAGELAGSWLVFVVDTTALKATKRKLERSTRLHALGELAGGVAHDFNNVLGIVITYAEMLQLRLVDHQTDEVGEWLRKLQHAVERGRTLTHQLLTFSRDHHAQKVDIQLNAVVNELVDLLGRIIGANIELDVALDAQLPALSANLPQIEQVLMNLVVNARDAMPDGGTLRITTRCQSVEANNRAHSLAVGDYIVLEVSDTGQGMDQETMDKIFEPFFTTKQKGEGTGLGLATVYGIVDDAGGTIQVESEPGVGTTMKLYFPTERTCPSPHGAEGGDARSYAPTVLLVEAQDDLRGPFRDYLSAQGYSVVEASTCQEARDAYDRCERIDVVVTDTRLPDGSGLELAERLGARDPRLNLVFLSGYVSELRKEKREGSWRVYLPKPIGLSELHDAIEGLDESR